VSWQHINSENVIVEQNLEQQIGSDESEKITDLDIRIVLTNGDDSGLIESECRALISHCCATKNSSVIYFLLNSCILDMSLRTFGEEIFNKAVLQFVNKLEI
jgi:hypothetical protein